MITIALAILAALNLCAAIRNTCEAHDLRKRLSFTADLVDAIQETIDGMDEFHELHIAWLEASMTEDF